MNEKKQSTVSSEYEMAEVAILETSCPLRAMLSVKNGQADLGWLRSNPKDLNAIDRLLTTIGLTSIQRKTIKVSPDQSFSVGNSAAAHPLHTDGTMEQGAPRLIALTAEEVDGSNGGISLAASAKALVARLPHETVTVLSTFPIAFERVGPTGTEVGPALPILFSPSNTGAGIRWREDAEVHPKVDQMPESVLGHLDTFRRCLSEIAQVQIRLCQGDTLILNNEGLLHGRTLIGSIHSQRVLKRVWIQ